MSATLRSEMNTDVTGELPRTVERSLRRNTLFISSTTITNALFGYGFWVIAARSLDGTSLGLATSAAALFTFLAQVLDLGLSTTVIQRLPRVGSISERHQLLVITVACTTIAAMIVAALALFVAPRAVPLLFSTLGIAGLLSALACAYLVACGRLLDAAASADRNASKMWMRNVIFAATKLLLLIVLLSMFHGHGPMLVVISTAIGALIANLCMFRFLDVCRDESKREMRSLAPADMASLFKDSFAHYVGNLGGEMPMFLLPLLVLALGGAQAAGTYYVTAMVAMVLYLGSSAISSSMLAEAIHNPGHLGDICSRAFRIVLPLTATAVLGCIVLGKTVLGLFGPRIADDGYVLLVLMAGSAIPDAVTNIWLARWRAMHHSVRAAVLNATMGLSALLLAALWYPRLGLAAVGWAWLTVQTLGCVGIWIVETASHRHHHQQQQGQVCASF